MEQTVLGSNPVVLLFIKAPRQGFVKTRLASDIGEVAATEVYKRLVRCQAAEIPSTWALEIHYTPDDGAGEIRELIGSTRRYKLFPQSKGNLGARLACAFDTASLRHPDRLLFGIGGDCPDLTGSLLNQAARSLSEIDLVIGPALDGGYYLIGMHAPEQTLFKDIAWGTRFVFQETRRQAEQAGLSWACLRMLEDVDDLPSLKRVRPEFLENLAIPIDSYT